MRLWKASRDRELSASDGAEIGKRLGLRHVGYREQEQLSKAVRIARFIRASRHRDERGPGFDQQTFVFGVAHVRDRCGRTKESLHADQVRIVHFRLANIFALLGLFCACIFGLQCHEAISPEDALQVHATFLVPQPKLVWIITSNAVLLVCVLHACVDARFSQLLSLCELYA